jgi:hypothetical protein
MPSTLHTYAGDTLLVRYSTEKKKTLMMPEPVRYRTKPALWRFLVWNSTEMMDAEMSIPALVSSMPLPNYDVALIRSLNIS